MGRRTKLGGNLVDGTNVCTNKWGGEISTLNESRNQYLQVPKVNSVGDQSRVRGFSYFDAVTVSTRGYQIIPAFLDQLRKNHNRC